MLLRSDIDRLEEIKSYIREHLEDKLSIQALSIRFGLSASTLRRQFLLHTGTTIHRHILCTRMERAKVLLGECRYTISEISSQLGYSEASNFSHAFLKYFGIPPSRITRSPAV